MYSSLRPSPFSLLVRHPAVVRRPRPLPPAHYTHTTRTLHNCASATHAGSRRHASDRTRLGPLLSDME